MTFDATYSKSIFTSTTFWGALLSLVASVAPRVLHNIIGTADYPTVAAIAASVATFLITVYGRFTAKQVVTLTGGPVPPASVATGTKG